MAKAKSGRLALGSDGELLDGDEAHLDRSLLDSQAEGAPAYCNQCGTSNLPNAHYCRKCGYDLVAQDAAMIGMSARRDGFKSKNKTSQRDAMLESGLQLLNTAPATVRELVTLLCVAGMAITAMVAANDTFGTIAALIAFVGVSAVRRTVGNLRRVTVGSALIDILTMMIVTGIFITAVVVASSRTVAVASLILWVGSEAVRNTLDHS